MSLGLKPNAEITFVNSGGGGKKGDSEVWIKVCNIQFQTDSEYRNGCPLAAPTAPPN